MSDRRGFTLWSVGVNLPRTDQGMSIHLKFHKEMENRLLKLEDGSKKLLSLGIGSVSETVVEPLLY